VVYPKTRDLNPALLINPEAGRNKKQWPLLAALVQQAGWPFVLAVTPEEIEKAFFDLCAKGRRLIWVSGGDGTAAQVLTSYFRWPEANRPALSLLPGGTTNLVPRDLGHTDQIKALRRALSGRPPRFERRAVLRVTPPGVCGFFLGAGLIAEGVERFRSHRAAGGNPWKALSFLPRKVWRQSTEKVLDFVETGDLLLRGPFWFFLATTLKRLWRRFAPWPSCPAQEIKALAFKQGAGLRHCLAALLKPNPSRDLSLKGIYSLCVPRVIVYTREVALDGEPLVSPDNRFALEIAGEVEFWVW